MSSAERQVEHEVERGGAPVPRPAGPAGCRPRPGGRRSPPRRSWTSGGSTPRGSPAGPGPARQRPGRGSARSSRGRASTSFHSSTSASGMGSVMLICITIGRQAICGYTSPGSAAPRSTVRSAAPGLSARATSAVQVTGIAVAHRELGELVDEQPGTDGDLHDPLAELARGPTPGHRPRPSSANRLGTGRPNAPWWAGCREVEKPIAPAVHRLPQRARASCRSRRRSRPAPRRPARTGATASGR